MVHCVGRLGIMVGEAIQKPSNISVGRDDSGIMVAFIHHDP